MTKNRELGWTKNGTLLGHPDAIEGHMQNDEEYSIASLNAVYERVAERAMAQAHANNRTVSRQGCNRMFSDEIVREIRLAKTPQDVKRLMKKYSVSSSTIYQIRALHCYRGVE